MPRRVLRRLDLLGGARTRHVWVTSRSWRWRTVALIIAPESIAEVGCIHTCQGLEVDYVGVIIGADLVVEDGEVRTVPAARASQDQSIKGYKSMMRSDPERATTLGDLVVKNTYRTLMTRGMKGCYVYCVDTGLANRLRSRLVDDASPTAAD